MATDKEIIDSLKTDWMPTDYYNYEDLDRVESAALVVKDKIASFRGVSVELDSFPNLMPYDNEFDKFQAWYNNLEITSFTFPSGRVGIKARMNNFAYNPRMRIVASTSNITQLIKGKSYTFSVIFDPSVKLEKVELLSLYYYEGVTPTFWQDFDSVDVNALESENLVDSTLKYEVTFVADATGGVRPSFGFGLGNPQMEDTVWVNIVEYSIKEVRSEAHIEFANSLNRIENNILRLKETFPNTALFEPSKTDWTHDMPFDFADAIRLEKGLYDMYYAIENNISTIPYCGQIITGEQGVI
jgi:hypothetical protein